MAQGCCGGGNNNNGGSNGGGGNGSGHGGSGGGNGGNGGGNNNNNKTEELQPHPLKEQLPGVQYCVNSPPPWRMHSPLPFFSNINYQMFHVHFFDSVILHVHHY